MTTDILALFDQERYNNEIPNMRREANLEIVRYIDLVSTRSTITYTKLSLERVEAVIEQEVAYFEELDHEFEWKVYSQDIPSDLKAHLVAHGFEAEEPAEAIVVLAVDNAPAKLLQPVSLDIRRITYADQLADVREIHDHVWQNDSSWLVDFLAATLESSPNYISIYVAYKDNQPVSCGWTFFPMHSQFAGLFGGSTVAAYRQNGYYTALLAARLQEAQQRGVPYLTVDAGPMSLPVLEKLGFRLLCHATACNWHGKSAVDKP